MTYMHTNVSGRMTNSEGCGLICWSESDSLATLLHAVSIITRGINNTSCLDSHACVRKCVV
jgi:hypothetical protein